MKLSHIFLLSISLLPFQAQAMNEDEIIEKVYYHNYTYDTGIFNYYRNESTLSTQAQRPQKQWNQNSLVYDKNSKSFRQETILKKIVPGQDGRECIANTTAWPYSIHAQLSMRFNGKDHGGSGVMVGPYHLLTCGHCVYDFDKMFWAEEIDVYPALNGKMAPFGKAQVTKAYVFKRWVNQGDQQFDIALLLLDQPIGDYVGWGGLLSTTDTELEQEKVNITGYPGDKGFKYMWSMSHKLKTVKPERFEYEIDTCGGQSGSAIWMNKWGTPMIVGVHSLGSDSINSGVRLSAKKFTVILRIIPHTYTLIQASFSTLSISEPKIQPAHNPNVGHSSYGRFPSPTLPDKGRNLFASNIVPAPSPFQWNQGGGFFASNIVPAPIQPTYTSLSSHSRSSERQGYRFVDEMGNPDYNYHNYFRSTQPDTNSPEALRLEIQTALTFVDKAKQNLEILNSPASQNNPRKATLFEHWEYEHNNSIRAANTAMQKLYELTGERHPRMNEMKWYMK